MNPTKAFGPVVSCGSLTIGDVSEENPPIDFNDLEYWVVLRMEYLLLERLRLYVMFRHDLHFEFLIVSLPTRNTHSKEAYSPGKGVQAFPDRFPAMLHVERHDSFDSHRFVFY